MPAIYSRLGIVLSSGLVFLGAGVRCLFLVYPELPDPLMTGLCHLGAILNGIPSIIVTSVPPAVSAAWFPPEVGTPIRNRRKDILN